MPSYELLDSIKLDQRITHDSLDADLLRLLEEGLADLQGVGVCTEPVDDRIRSALRMWCRAYTTDDPGKAEQYLERYNALKGALQLSGDYTGVDDDE